MSTSSNNNNITNHKMSKEIFNNYGEVKILDDDDFDRIRNLCQDNENWNCVYERKNNKVWTLQVSDSDFLMYRVSTEYTDIDADTVYDVLHDPIYRKKWDKYMLDSKDIGMINPNTDICYYAVGSVPPFKSRDFVMQRSWLDMGNEKFICSHSICHKDYPPFSKHIRAIVYLTAYQVIKLDEGCRITYVTHSDPRGKLPTWFVNRLTKTIAPGMIKKLHKYCLSYKSWKTKHNENVKPWRFPEQMIGLPKVDLADCEVCVYDDELNIIDESNINDCDVEVDSIKEN
uniref:START domain-containing protein 10 n=1 Tax=Parastrongyloides trichosuri TaxID=131310 RepID=A0A0N4Z953_PARTI